MSPKLSLFRVLYSFSKVNIELVLEFAKEKDISIIIKTSLIKNTNFISTFMSSTNEGNPPIVIKVMNEATNMSSEPLA